jgi:hypothetical protein
MTFEIFPCIWSTITDMCLRRSLMPPGSVLRDILVLLMLFSGRCGLPAEELTHKAEWQPAASCEVDNLARSQRTGDD